MAAGAMGLGGSKRHRFLAAGTPHLAAGRVAMERLWLGMAAGAMGLGADLTDWLAVHRGRHATPSLSKVGGGS